MASILDDLAEDVAAALTGALRSATYWAFELIGVNEFNEEIYDWVSYPCEGVRGSFDALYIASGAIPVEAAKIEIIASTLAVEARQTDRIHIEGAWWAIVRIERDPAGALWICQCAESGAPA